MHTYTHIHTHKHAHTYIHTCIHIYIRVCVRRCVDTDRLTDEQRSMNAKSYFIVFRKNVNDTRTTTLMVLKCIL